MQIGETCGTVKLFRANRKDKDRFTYDWEGNSGDACKQHRYAVGGNSIYGYGVPDD